MQENSDDYGGVHRRMQIRILQTGIFHGVFSITHICLLVCFDFEKLPGTAY